LLIAAVFVFPVGAYSQQQSQEWFVPGQQRPAQKPAPKPAPRPAGPAPQVQVPVQPPPAANAEPPEPIPQAPLPPMPELPAVPKGAAPPSAVIGVLGVPDVMRASTAAQEIEKVIGERRDKLNQDAQKEQAAWRDVQQALANQRNTLTPDQVRNREKELQDRITNAQKQLRERSKIIQEAAQYSLAQVERALVGVIRQAADARGMNLVLHRAQVALNINEFDITQDVTDQLNKVLPSVVIPADGVSPSAAAAAAAKAGGGETPTATPATTSEDNKTGAPAGQAPKSN
jgi:Skp family chaperone for outer membrane proteins